MIMEEETNKVLVIDDNEVIRHLAATLLSKSNYLVRTAKNGLDGIIMAKTFSPMVILLDVMMPEMNGYEVCKKLKEDYKTRDIPIIMVTSKTEPVDKVKGLELGAADYVAKPFDHMELLARVATQAKMKKLWDELQEKNRTLEDLSKKDGLTNLFNHRYFQERIAEEFSRAARYDFPLTCILMDIDYFKKVNDTYGHQAGDEILRFLAKIVLETIRDVDIAARYGGEEFVLILPHTPLENAFVMAERLRELVESTAFSFNDLTIKITISLGVAGLPHNKPLTHTELIRFADEALYAAKESGRNRVEQSRKS
ncbi:MAG: diguanylate cyclase [Pseudomonadota bacterium]